MLPEVTTIADAVIEELYMTSERKRFPKFTLRSSPRRQGEIGGLKTAGKIPQHAVSQDDRTALYSRIVNPPG